MYSAPYGFPGGGGQPPPNAHLQSANSPPQPQQQMMYNPQQFPMGGQGSFPGGPNMMPGAVAGPGMMPNAGVPHNGPIAYQTPYSGPPYVAGAPPQGAGQGQMPPNYMMGGPMGNFPLNAAGGMNPQQMMPRMQPPQQSPTSMGTPTSQRQFNQAQASPTNPVTPQQPQFSAPQATPMSQVGQAGPQQMPAGSTPQTPTFPSTGTGSGANGAVMMPLSPGTESKEKERFQLLLDINQELLYESVQLQNTKAELRKEAAANSAEAGGKPAGADSPEDKLIQQDYTQCMRRLHSNLAYLASLADKKGNVQVPPSPSYLMSPPLNLTIKMRGTMPAPEGKDKPPPDPTADRVVRDQYLKELYAKLQALFPGVDPSVEPQLQGGGQGQNQAGRGAAVNPGGSTEASPIPGAQKTPQMAASAAPLAQPRTVGP